MTTPLHAWMAVRPYLIGVVLSTGAMFLGYDWGSETARLLGGEPGIWTRMGKGFVWGAVTGALQWPIVRPVGVRPIRLVVASAVGFAIGYPLGQAIHGICYFKGGLHWIWAYGAALTMFGLFLGMPQWWIFRRHMRRAYLWILFSVTGWILTGVAWINFGGTSGVDAIAYGLVTGLGLVWLVQCPLRAVGSGVTAQPNVNQP